MTWASPPRRLAASSSSLSSVPSLWIPHPYPRATVLTVPPAGCALPLTSLWAVLSLNSSVCARGPSSTGPSFLITMATVTSPFPGLASYLILFQGQIGKEYVHQGCILSPCLFNFYAEYIVRNAGLEEAQAGIKIARRGINNLRCPDNTTLMAESEGELKSFLMKVKEKVKKLA